MKALPLAALLASAPALSAQEAPGRFAGYPHEQEIPGYSRASGLWILDTMTGELRFCFLGYGEDAPNGAPRQVTMCTPPQEGEPQQ